MTIYEWGVLYPAGWVESFITERGARIVAADLDDCSLVRREIGPWEPVLSETEQAATDAYRETIEAALTKIEPPRIPVPDLMAALEASLAAARADREKIATALPDTGQVSPM